MNKDLEHLRWLSIGFYVYAALTALFACFPFIHLFIGIAMVTGSFESEKNPPPAAVGWIFIGAASIFILMGFALAICSFLAGKYLKQQTKYTFCFVMAVINCMFAPLGTLLGIFTIIVLLRDSVKPLFNGGYSPQSFNQTGFNPPDWK
jgi:hypothetical protein